MDEVRIDPEGRIVLPTELREPLQSGQYASTVARNADGDVTVRFVRRTATTEPPSPVVDQPAEPMDEEPDVPTDHGSVGTITAGWADWQTGRTREVTGADLIQQAPSDPRLAPTVLMHTTSRSTYLVTLNWDQVWNTLPEPDQLRVLDLMLAATRRPTHPSLTVSPTFVDDVYAIGAESESVRPVVIRRRGEPDVWLTIFVAD